MTDAAPFRTRSFQAIPPEQRPRKSRAAVRVIVTDGTSTLLLIDTDPGHPGSRWYFTPGGGIDAGESPREAAVRELREETGLQVTASDLIGPVMRRVVVHGYSDQVLVQSEEFFVLRTPRFEIDAAGRTADEQLSLVGHAWLPIAGLADVALPVWPAVLGEVLARTASGAGLWDMGVVEESTVPVADASLG